MKIREILVVFFYKIGCKLNKAFTITFVLFIKVVNAKGLQY